MAGDRVHQSVAKPPQLKDEHTSVIEIETTSGAQRAAAFVPPYRRLMRWNLHVEASAILAAIRRVVLLASALVVLGGVVTFAVGGYSSMDTFRRLSKSVTLSDGILALMHEYHSILIAATVVASLALAAYVPIVCLAIYRDMAFDSAEGYIRKTPGRLAKALSITLLFLLLAAVVLSVLAIAANVRAMDTVNTTANQASGGYSMLTQASAAVTSLQGNNTSALQGLFTTVIDTISGNPSTAGGDPLSQVSSNTSLQGLFDLISPVTVGTLVDAISATPQGILQLAAVLSNRIAPTNTPGLACSNQCLNVQGYACICTLTDLSTVTSLCGQADSSLLVSLYGACILAACFAVQLASLGEQVARTAFQEKLLFSDSFDRQLAWRRGRLQEINAAALRFSTPRSSPLAEPSRV